MNIVIAIRNIITLGLLQFERMFEDTCFIPDEDFQKKYVAWLTNKQRELECSWADACLQSLLYTNEWYNHFENARLTNPTQLFTFLVRDGQFEVITGQDEKRYVCFTMDLPHI